MRLRFRRFPTPKKRRMEKRERDTEKIKPRRELAKTSENVKSIVTKKVIKKMGITAKTFGSTKYTKAAKSIQKRIVSKRVGRKFLRFIICSCLKCFFICNFYFLI